MAYKQLKDASMTVGYVGGWCLKYVQDSFGTDHPYPTAIAEWNATSKYNHTERPPAGVTVPVFFSLGNVPAGHVAISLNDGYVASSTQAGTHATPYFHKNLDDLIAVYGKYNGGCTYLGWSEMVGNVQVVQAVSANATDAEINQAYQDVLGRQADSGGLSHYRNYPAAFVRQDLLNSAEYAIRQANLQAAAVAAKEATDAKIAADQAQIIAAAKTLADTKALADAKAKADADALAQAQADTLARQKATEAQAQPDAVSAHIQNSVDQNNSLLKQILAIVQAIFDKLNFIK